MIIKLQLSFILVIVILNLTACGGSSPESNDNSADNLNPEVRNIPAGKVMVDGHIFNPDFYTDDQDFYVKISYFDTSGNLTSYHDVYEWEGTTPTYLEDDRFTYDNEGRLKSSEHETTYTREGLEFYIHSFRTNAYTYNAEGRLIAENIVENLYDETGDGIYVNGLNIVSSYKPSITYRYNDAGQLVTKTFDMESDGSLETSTSDRTTYFEYNNTGNLVKEIVHKGNQSVTTREFEYDGNGNRIKSTRYPTLERFYSNDSASITNYTYDLVGNVIEEVIDGDQYGSYMFHQSDDRQILLLHSVMVVMVI